MSPVSAAAASLPPQTVHPPSPKYSPRWWSLLSRERLERRRDAYLDVYLRNRRNGSYLSGQALARAVLCDREIAARGRFGIWKGHREANPDYSYGPDGLLTPPARGARCPSCGRGTIRYLVSGVGMWRMAECSHCNCMWDVPTRRARRAWVGVVR